MASPVDGGSLEVFTSGRARRVDVRSLEKELLKLWKSAVEAGEAGAIQPVTRAAVLTLVLVVRGQKAVNEATEMIARLTEAAPCRALVVHRLEAEADPPLNAWASAHCHRVAGGRQVCCEQVTIEASPSAEDHLSGLLIPLFVPDLPVFVHWPDVLGDCVPAAFPPFLKRLWKNVEFIVLDSSRAADSEEAISILAAMARAKGPGHPRPRDLNWSRLLPWREVIAGQFDPPDRRSWPDDLLEIRIRATVGPACEGPAGVPARPLLLLNWLTGRLAWKRRDVRREGGEIQLDYDDGRPKRARLILSGEESPRGRIDEVTCSFTADRRLSVHRSVDGSLEVAAVMPGCSVPARTITRHREEDLFLLGTELGHRGSDPIFNAALLEAGAVVYSLKRSGR